MDTYNFYFSELIVHNYLNIGLIYNLNKNKMASNHESLLIIYISIEVFKRNVRIKLVRVKSVTVILKQTNLQHLRTKYN